MSSLCLRLARLSSSSRLLSRPFGSRQQLVPESLPWLPSCHHQRSSVVCAIDSASHSPSSKQRRGESQRCFSSTSSVSSGGLLPTAESTAAATPARDKFFFPEGDGVVTPSPSMLSAPSCDPLAQRHSSSVIDSAQPPDALISEASGGGGSRTEDGGRSRRAPSSPPSFRDLLSIYAELGKARLSSLVVLTSGAGFLMAGAPASWPALAAATVGTSLAAAAAGTFNQVWEVGSDGQMKRTQLRPLPDGRISSNHALAFGTATAAVSASTLLLGANALTALLGVGNILLYAAIYTPLKVRSVLNTAVGALVGAVPPLMGWAAATGGLLAYEPMLLGLTLYWWQFPHFYSLAWTLRKDYARGGYVMLPVVDETGGRQTAWAALRSAGALSLIPLAATALGVCSPMFAVEGIALNAYFLALALRFWREPSDAAARKLFRTSLWYLPVLLALMVFHSKHWAQQHVEEESSDAKLAAELLEGSQEGSASLTLASTTSTAASAGSAAAAATLQGGGRGGGGRLSDSRGEEGNLTKKGALLSREGSVIIVLGGEKRSLNSQSVNDLLQAGMDQLHAWGRALCLHELFLYDPSIRGATGVASKFGELISRLPRILSGETPLPQKRKGAAGPSSATHSLPPLPSEGAQAHSATPLVMSKSADTNSRTSSSLSPACPVVFMDETKRVARDITGGFTASGGDVVVAPHSNKGV